MAMTMLCASMGVLATETATTSDTEVLRFDFEGVEYVADEGLATIKEDDSKEIKVTKQVEETVGEGDSAVKYTITPPQGEQMAVIKDAGTGTYFEYDKPGDRSPLEWGSLYKLSFWWYCTAQEKAPAIYLVGGGTGMQANNTYYIPSTGWRVGRTWRYYTMYFVTADPTETTTNNVPIEIRFRGISGAVQYFDDITISKADGAFLNFATVSKADSTIAATSNLTSDNFWKTASYITLQNGYAVGSDYPSIPVYAIRYEPTAVCTEYVQIVSQYIPKVLGEKTTLVAAIYSKDEKTGLDKLETIKTQDFTYGLKTYSTANYGEKILLEDAGVRYMNVDMREYEGCYIKAFMWSSVSGMVPVSGTAILPAAPVAETPAA